MKFMDLFIGGVLPAIFLGVGTVLMRLSTGFGISIPVYLLTVGSTVLTVGGIATILQGGGINTNIKAVSSAAAMGLFWSGAIGCITYGFSVLRLPVSQVAPLTNSNAVVAVLLGAVIFAEWQSLQMVKVILGTLLICAGAVLVSTAK